MFKIFLFYYLISGLINLYYTQKYWDDIEKSYPQLQIMEKDFVLFLQFSLGFILILTWFPKYIFMSIKNWIETRKLNSRGIIHLEALSEEEMKKLQQEMEEKRKEMMLKYSRFIQDFIQCGDKPLKSIYGGIQCTLQDLKTDMISSFLVPHMTIRGEKLQIKSKHIMVKEDHFIILTEDKVYLMEGWKTACVITNPFPNGREQSEEI